MLVCGLLLRAVAARPENSRASEAPGAWPARMPFVMPARVVHPRLSRYYSQGCITKACCTKLNASNDETKGPYLRCGAELGWRPFGSEANLNTPPRKTSLLLAKARCAASPPPLTPPRRRLGLEEDLMSNAQVSTEVYRSGVLRGG